MDTLSGWSERRPAYARCASASGIAAAALLLILTPSPLRAQAEVTPRKDGSYLTPPEIMKLAEDSGLVYELRPAAELKDATVDQFVDLFWPADATERGYPIVSSSGPEGGRSLTYDSLQDCHKQMKKAGEAFAAKEYEEARMLYEKTTRKEPACHIAWLYFGDALLRLKKPQEALDAYDRGIALNPHDFRGPFFRASALTELGRLDEARSSYARALALRPHRKPLHDAIRTRTSKLGITLVDEPFKPKAFARREGEKVAVYLANPDESWWIVYGMCKGIWIGETRYREERTGRAEHQWSSVEEEDCLFSMLDNYVALLEEKKISADPQMDRLLAVVKAGLHSSYVFYEIGYRMAPDLTLLLPESSFTDLLRYVETFVIPKAVGP